MRKGVPVKGKGSKKKIMEFSIRAGWVFRFVLCFHVSSLSQGDGVTQLGDPTPLGNNYIFVKTFPKSEFCG